MKGETTKNTKDTKKDPAFVIRFVDTSGATHDLYRKIFRRQG